MLYLDLKHLITLIVCFLWPNVFEEVMDFFSLARIKVSWQFIRHIHDFSQEHVRRSIPCPLSCTCLCWFLTARMGLLWLSCHSSVYLDLQMETDLSVPPCWLSCLGYSSKLGSALAVVMLLMLQWSSGGRGRPLSSGDVHFGLLAPILLSKAGSWDWKVDSVTVHCLLT